MLHLIRSITIKSLLYGDNHVQVTGQEGEVVTHLELLDVTFESLGIIIFWID